MKGRLGKGLKKAVIIVFWIVVWELLFLAVHNSLIVPAPGDVVKAFIGILCGKDLYIVLANSLGRILAGLLCAFLAGIFLAVCSYLFKTAEEFLGPLFLCIKAVPVASYVILLLIWRGSEMLSVGISFLVALPIVYTNILEGLKETDRRMLELAEVFGMRRWNRIWHIYRAELTVPVLSCVKVVCSMGIKAGAAAEIIGIPGNSFGEKLYMSKIYLKMDELFAWTIAIVLSALVLEKLLLLLAEGILHMPVSAAENSVLPAHNSMTGLPPGTIYVENLTKIFDNRVVLRNVNLDIKQGSIVGIMKPSGSGKTTLCRILLGLEQADGGTVEVSGRVSAVFQDALLCEQADALTNMRLASSGTKNVNEIAEALLDKEDLCRQCSLFSGGMKRRTAVGRALSADYDILLLDEPFVSLDDETRRRTAEFVKKQAAGKTILLFTHDEEDIKLLGGVCYESKQYVSG